MLQDFSKPMHYLVSLKTGKWKGKSSFYPFKNQNNTYKQKTHPLGNQIRMRQFLYIEGFQLVTEQAMIKLN